MSDNTNTPQYTPDTMLAFIDILGFKELLKNRGLPKIVEMMNNILASDNSPDYVKMLDIKTKLISDSFVVYAQLTESKQLSAFFVFLGTVIGQIHLIGDLITRGFVSNGEHYSTDKLWISPVFVEAYNGEQKITFHPRVILSNSAVKQINRLDPNFIDLPHFKIDTDGFRHINYLTFVSNTYQPSGDTINAVASGYDFSKLNGHKQNIINGLDNNMEHRNKYHWLANYHNTFINDNYNRKNKQELLIDLTHYRN